GRGEARSRCREAPESDAPAAFAEGLEQLDRPVPPPCPQAPGRAGKSLPLTLAERLEQEHLALRALDRDPGGNHPRVVDDDQCIADRLRQIAESPVPDPAERAIVDEQP